MKKPKPDSAPAPEKRRAGVPVPVVLMLLAAAFGVGLVLNQGRDPGGSRSGASGTLPTVAPPQPGATGGKQGAVALPPPAAQQTPPPGTAPKAPPTAPTPTPGHEPGTGVKLPPYNPPSLGSGRQGEGEVVDFYDPDRNDPAKRAKHEAERAKAWEERVKAENDRLVALMTERLQLTPGQAGEVKKILADQAVARQELVKGLMSGSVPRTDMEDRVKAIKAQTEDRLKASMTASQWEGYVKLDPKDQPTNPDAAGPR